MKHSNAVACLSCDLLKFVRDSNPTEAALLAWLGDRSDEGRFHVLRKAQLIVVNTGRVSLSQQHLSADASQFHYGNRVYNIDDDTIDIVCYAPTPIANKAT